jgi:hypothetical protein
MHLLRALHQFALKQARPVEQQYGTALDDVCKSYPNIVVTRHNQEERIASIVHIIRGGAELLSFSGAAALSQIDAEVLNLPPPFPYQLEVHSKGSIGSDRFEISYCAVDQGVRKPGHFSEGLFTIGDKQYRISGILFDIIQRASDINSSETMQEKLVGFSELRLLLDNDDAALSSPS